MSFLFPHEDTFFTVIKHLDTEVQKELTLIISTLENQEPNLHANRCMKASNHELHKEFQTALKQLTHAFITPFDREDILSLILSYQHLSRNMRTYILDISLLHADKHQDWGKVVNIIKTLSHTLQHISHTIQSTKISPVTLEIHLKSGHNQVDRLQNTIEETFAEHMTQAEDWKSGLSTLNNTKNLREIAESIASLLRRYETIFVKGL